MMVFDEKSVERGAVVPVSMVSPNTTTKKLQSTPTPIGYRDASDPVGVRWERICDSIGAFDCSISWLMLKLAISETGDKAENAFFYVNDGGDGRLC